MELDSAIRQRRSIRRFTAQQVSDEQIGKLLEAARLAPSSKNLQQWSFVVLRGADKDAVAQLTGNAGSSESMRASGTAMCESSALIMVYQRVSSGFFRSDMLSIGACIENICLKAVDLGLGALWICDVDEAEQAINAALGIRAPLIAAVAVGYAAESPSARPRLQIDDIVEWRQKFERHE